MYELKLKVKPFSLNNAYFYNKKYNNKAREYRELFLQQLMLPSNQKVIKLIKSNFDLGSMGLKVEFLWYLPESLLFTKLGYISRKSMDLDNCLKLPIDFLCNKKYESNLGIDDTFIVDINTRKLKSLGNDNFVIIRVSFVNNSSL